MLCIVEDAGRRWVALCSEQEWGWVLCREGDSWLCLMHAVPLLRVLLLFGQAHGSVTLTEDGAVATKNTSSDCYRTAASTAMVRSGRHFMEFTVVENSVMFGVVWPGWNVEGGEEAEEVVRWMATACFYWSRGRAPLPRRYRLGGEAGRGERW